MILQGIKISLVPVGKRQRHYNSAAPPARWNHVVIRILYLWSATTILQPWYNGLFLENNI